MLDFVTENRTKIPSIFCIEELMQNDSHLYLRQEFGHPLPLLLQLSLQSSASLWWTPPLLLQSLALTLPLLQELLPDLRRFPALLLIPSSQILQFCLDSADSGAFCLQLTLSRLSGLACVVRRESEWCYCIIQTLYDHFEWVSYSFVPSELASLCCCWSAWFASFNCVSNSLVLAKTPWTKASRCWS